MRWTKNAIRPDRRIQGSYKRLPGYLDLPPRHSGDSSMLSADSREHQGNLIYQMLVNLVLVLKRSLWAL
jgi:hypothetical protein